MTVIITCYLNEGHSKYVINENINKITHNLRNASLIALILKIISIFHFYSMHLHCVYLADEATMVLWQLLDALRIAGLNNRITQNLRPLKMIMIRHKVTKDYPKRV